MFVGYYPSLRIKVIGDVFSKNHVTIIRIRPCDQSGIVNLLAVAKTVRRDIFWFWFPKSIDEGVSFKAEGDRWTVPQD